MNNSKITYHKGKSSTKENLHDICLTNGPFILNHKGKNYCRISSEIFVEALQEFESCKYLGEKNDQIRFCKCKYDFNGGENEK